MSKEDPNGAAKLQIKEILKPLRKNKKLFHTITAPNPGWLQIDLMVMEKEATRNKNFAYGLCIVDIYSRQGTCIPMKSKKASETGEKFEKYIKNVPFTVEDITTDDGKEWMGDFQKVVIKNNIRHYIVEKEDHHAMGIVDSFIRNMRRRILEVWIKNGNVDWISHIDSIVKDYNNTLHSTIHAKPVDVLKNKINPTQILNKVVELDIGDNVRTMIKKDKFDKKSSTQNYSSEVYKIKEQDGNKYLLEGRPGERWALWELQKTEFKPSQKAKRKILHKVPASLIDTQHEIKEKAKQKRFLAKEDLVPILPPIREKRERKVPERYGFSGSGFMACKF